jgi:DNA processing protein
MSAAGRTGGEPGACARCARRSWLLSMLSGPLDCCARDRWRLIELLALADEELLRAVAGTRKADLHAQYARFGSEPPVEETRTRMRETDAQGGIEADVETICHHRRDYPHALDGPAAPHMLEVAGGAARLAELASAPVVAVLGSTRASDYGIEMARGLARGLAASGVSVAGSVTDGIAAAAHAGALEAGAGSIAVMGGGLGVACPARWRSLYERVVHAGCAVSELPHDCAGRRWGQLASARILVELASVAVLVEADETAEDLFAARLARARGRTVAAIPGRVTSPLSRGTHALLMDGASLVRGPGDVLELLYRCGEAAAGRRSSASGSAWAPVSAGATASGEDSQSGLRRELRLTLERVGAGCDTPDKLTRAGVDAAEALLALSELELMGLLARGDGGRYLPTAPSN